MNIELNKDLARTAAIVILAAITIWLITGCSNTPEIKNPYDAIAVAHAEIKTAARVIATGYDNGQISSSDAVRLKGLLQQAHNGLSVATVLLEAGNSRGSREAYYQALGHILNVQGQIQ